MKSYLYRLSVVLCLMISGPVVQANDASTLLNDLHSRLNPTRVQEVLYPGDADDVIDIVARANKDNMPIRISGGMHSMGGQQFGTGTLHLSTSKMDDVLAFARKKGVITVEAGIQWPALIDYLVDTQRGEKDSSLLRTHHPADLDR